MNTCYTVITKGYDELKPCPESRGWEYIVFTDSFIDVHPWRCVITDKHNRELKLRPQGELFNNLTLYVDGSIQITGDLNQFCSEVPQFYTAWKHPHRDTVRQEASAVVRLKGCDKTQVKEQIDRYRDAGWRDNMGLAACGVLLRDLSDKSVRDINHTWYREWKNSCGRDQLSFMYSFWRSGYAPDLFGNDIFNKYFKWGKHL